MGKKYIIELEENEHLYKTEMVLGEPVLCSVLPEPYTEPDLEKVRKEAYEKGFDAGRMLNKGKYEKGLNDAWEAARTIVKMEWEEKNKIFGKLILLSNIFSDNTASEAIEKLKQYEDSKQEIKIGDEVVGVFSDGKETRPFVFIRGSQQYYFGLYSDTLEFCQGGLNLRKTGRHFHELVSAIEKMKEGQDG